MPNKIQGSPDIQSWGEGRHLIEALSCRCSRSTSPLAIGWTDLPSLVSKCILQIEGAVPLCQYVKLVNLYWGVGKRERGVTVWRWTFAYWHCKHCRVHCQTSLLIPGHTKRLTRSRCDARIPGCTSECKAVKTACLNVRGTNERGFPVAISQTTVSLEKERGSRCNTRECCDRDLTSSANLESLCCAWATSWRSTMEGMLAVRELMFTRDRASAAELAEPLTWRMSAVNCKM